MDMQKIPLPLFQDHCGSRLPPTNVYQSLR